MNKALSIQQNKLFSSYGGVDSMIDTIEDLSLRILPFDKWDKLYQNVCSGRRNDLLLEEPRLCSLVRSLGFTSLTGFFSPDTTLDEDPSFKAYKPDSNQKAKMVQTTYFPTWFYCPKCHRFMPIDEWRDLWTHDNDFDKYAPACANCGGPGKASKRPKIQQTRFVMASLETGMIDDIPWKKIFSKHGSSDSTQANVWHFDDNSPECKSVTFHISSASTNLARIFIKNEKGEKVSMADIFNHYIVIEHNGEQTVYRPVVRSDNNVYYAYNINCLYIPQYVITQADVDRVKEFYDDGITDPAKIKRLSHLGCSEATIKGIIDAGFTVTIPVYVSEEQFRVEEYDFITDANNYTRGLFEDTERRLITHEYTFGGGKPKFIKSMYYQTRLNITTVQIAYSRIDKLSANCIPFWGGKNEPAKEWYDPRNDSIRDVLVALRPTCSASKDTIEKMPALSSYGEGFFIELAIDYIPDSEKKVFLHTFSHLLMKELEFVCGYPLASMSERLYFMPGDSKYGIMIYSVGGASGSYGGITSLFETKDIEKIIENACYLADDCSNDPICASEGGHCFACVHVPETTCELFNQDLSRLIFNKYKY